MRVLKNDYAGKSVFVGLDVHKETYVVATVCEGVVVKKWTMAADPSSLIEQSKRFFAGATINSAYEAGFSGFNLHRALIQNGINNIVVNPASIEVEANNKVKTDKKDAKKIAEQLAAGRLKSIYIPTVEEEQRRALNRGREQVIERRRATGNQIKMLLHYLGIRMPDSKKMSEVFLQQVEEVVLSKEHKFAIDQQIDAWRQDTKRIKAFDEELAKQAQTDSLETIFRSAPGIGPISARTLSNELGNMSRFDNEKELFSFTGLTPSEHSSGQNIRKGHISRQGSPRIRGLLIEVAWRAIVADLGLKEYYLRIASTRGGKRAIVAVARKIVGRLRHCLLNEKHWSDSSVKAG